MTKAIPKTPAKRTKAGTSKASAEQKRFAFVEAFFANGENASQAAITAGFAPKSAGVTGAKMLKDPRILLMVEQRRAQINAELGLNTDRLVKEIARLAFADPRKLLHPDGRIKLPHELDDATAAAIASFEVDLDGSIKYKLWDKNSAQERAAKILGVFSPEKIDHNVAVTTITRRVIDGKG